MRLPATFSLFLSGIALIAMLSGLLNVLCCPIQAQAQTQGLPAGTQPPFTYTNPLPFSYSSQEGREEREVRDPCIIREGDTYYLIFTMWPFANREDKPMELPDNGSSPGIRMYSSTDLMHWKDAGWLVKSSDLPQNSPYKHRFWAPEIHKFGDKYYLIFTADNWLKGEYNPAGQWGAAGYAFVGVADKITGPYQHITYIPDGACDTTLMQDKEGQIYAVMPKYDLFIRKIDLSGLEQGVVKWAGEEKKIVECKNNDIGLPNSPRYLEGPWVERIGDQYVLFYAAPYEEGYWAAAAYADNPMGPWRKDPRGKVFYGGHIATFLGPGDEHCIAYRIEDDDATRGLLAVSIFRIETRPNGQIQVEANVPTRGQQIIMLPNSFR